MSNIFEDIDELINAAVDQQPTRFASVFDDIMSQKISAQLDDQRISYAQQMFQSDDEENIDEDEFEDTDDIDLDDEDFDEDDLDIDLDDEDFDLDLEEEDDDGEDA